MSDKVEQVKTFKMYRRLDISTTHDVNQANPPSVPQFEGIVFSDGKCVIRWLTGKRSVAVWDCFEDMIAIHGHPEYGSELVWDALYTERAGETKTECKYEDWDDTCNPPICQCTLVDDFDTANRCGHTNDVTDCASYVAKSQPVPPVPDLMLTDEELLAIPYFMDRPVLKEYAKAQLAKVQPLLTALQAQVEEYKRQSTLTYCTYCGTSFEVDDEAGTKVTEHIKTCEKHPLYQANQTITANEAKIAELEARIEELENEVGSLNDNYDNLERYS